VLGYRHPSGLPAHVLDRADFPGRPRQWRRSTLWAIADELTLNGPATSAVLRRRRRV
jgi:hypothetical protein